MNQSCVFCHQEIAEEWQTSVHAGARHRLLGARPFSGDGSPGGGNGYVYTATHDPGETGTCATCHQVMSDVFTPGKTMFNANSGPGVQDGVSCLGCHQIHSLGDPDGTHTLGSAEYRFPLGRRQHGPLRLGPARRRRHGVHAGVLCALHEGFAALRLLPPVPAAFRPDHLRRMAGVALRGAGAEFPRLPGLPHAAARRRRRDLRPFRGAHPARRSSATSTTSWARRRRPWRRASASRPRSRRKTGGSRCARRSTISAPATTSRPASRSATPCW